MPGLIIRNAKLLDTSAGELRPGASLRIEADKIVEVAEDGRELTGDADIVVLDAEGRTMMPGRVLFQKKTDTRFQFVPYRGSAPAMQDLVAGQIDLAIDTPSNYLAQVRAASVKAYAVASRARLATAPDIPNVDEAGLPGFYASLWFGLWAPRGTPRNALAKLHAAVADALADPTVRSRVTDLGPEIFPRDQQTPEALAALHKAEIDKWWPIIKAANPLRPFAAT